MDSECNSLLFKSRLQENEVNLQQLLEYEEQVCQCQTLRLKVEDLQKRLEEKDNKLTEANKVIRALRDEVQTLQQQLEQHRRKYRDDDTIGQRRQQGRRARGNDITASGCEIPPNIFLSCTSGDDPTDMPTSPQELTSPQALEDDAAHFPMSPAYDDDDAELTSPRQLKLPVLSVKLQDCRELLGPHGVYKTQSIEDISDENEDDDDCYRDYQDDGDSDFDPTDPSFEEPGAAREKRKQGRGADRVKKAKAKKHHDNKPYACTECGKTFAVPSRLARHQKGQRKPKNLTTATACENASTESTQSASTDSTNAESDIRVNILSTKTCLKGHQRMHTGGVPYACTVCDKTFNLLCGLIQHQKQQHPQVTGEKAVKKRRKKKNVVRKCSVCPKEFTCSSDFKIHFKTVHRGEKRYLCSQCPMRFTANSNLIAHETLHSDQKPFACPVCGKAFKTKYSLKSHETMHTGLKPIACTYCNKTFRLKKKLQEHIRRHTGEKPYKCSFCDASFVNSTSLKDHVRRHTGERPYLCSICGKSFSQRHHLRTHMIVHTGAKPHQCSVCGEKFSYLQPLYDHEKKVHNIVSYPCQECGKIFKSDRGLKGHGCQNCTQVNNDKGVGAAKCIEGVEVAPTEH